ncbi:multidrug transporter [Pseudomonas savastanoi pv. glycinea]|nr:multidrug transporter [Pseudomonas amygdali pv. morsprunorum]POP97208.1 multidrug transporter [Pseudomonas amygdali pv. morsprunorum]PYD21573.1 multidrug transporter [Pseudomonas savastanoi pv. glycinea]
MPTRYRDAVTGEYITEKDAKKNPRESVKETDKPKPKSPSKPKGKK